MENAVGEKSKREMNNEINELIDENARYKVQIEAYKQERGRYQAEISELKEEHERALKQIEKDQIKISKLISEIDCKRSEIMPDEPIKAADCLIHAKGVRETNAIQRIRGAARYENYDLYSVSDLREIAEHLLSYCNNNERG